MYRHRLTRAAALGLALGVLAAPVASAQTDRDLWSPDARDAAIAAQTPQDLRSPDARDAAIAAQTPQDLRSPDARDAAEGRYLDKSPQLVIVTMPPKPKPQPQPAPADGIDWADAGIGAGGLLGLSLIAGGSTLFLVHRRRAADDTSPAAGL